GPGSGPDRRPTRAWRGDFQGFLPHPLARRRQKPDTLGVAAHEHCRATPKGESETMATSKKPAAGKKSASKPITEALGKSGLVAYLSEHSGVEPKGVRAVLATLEQAVANSVNKKGAG